METAKRYLIGDEPASDEQPEWVKKWLLLMNSKRYRPVDYDTGWSPKKTVNNNYPRA